MSNNNDSPIKEKEANRKIYIRFFAVLVISIIAGFMMGVGSSLLNKMDIQIDKYAMKKAMSVAFPVLFSVFDVVMIVISLIIHSINVRETKAWDGEDEDTIDSIEARMNVPLTLTSVLMIGGMFFFSLCTYVDSLLESSDKNYILSIATVVCFVISMVGTILIQFRVVELEKKLNPEKKGNVFDFNFVKQWEKSSDEAQRLIQYKGGYKAYFIGNFVCMIMWMISSVGMLFFNTGFMAVACVCAIWLVMTLAYVFEVAKLERKKK